MSSSVVYFDSLYQSSDDPWHLREGWYEQRKRALTLALLPRPRYRNGFEPGCANGELTAGLAARCDALLAADLHETAVRLTRERVADAPHVRVEQRIVPSQWPATQGPFDLIVISEFAYYLDAADLARLATQIAASLTPDGTLLACHWQRPFAESLQSAATAHALFDARCGLARLAHHDDADLLIDVWSRDGRSVAQQEGLL
jgi:SAM-dependent methyltransferase